MELEYDPETDVAYVRLSTLPAVWSEDLDAFRRVDRAGDGSPVGVRLLDVRHGAAVEGLPERQAVERLLRSRGIHPRVSAGWPRPRRAPAGLTAGLGMLLVVLVFLLTSAVILRGSVVALSLLLSAYLVARSVRWRR